jgi:undecaprenyl phosphate N,N'-diacetylbacillosamine 1-phosphate transferase
VKLYKHLLKPAIDRISALLLLVIASPVFTLLTILLYIENDGKPFFLQKRPGLNGKVFTLIKFKTMNDRKDAFGQLLPDAYRLTKVGSFVRKTSLDEIPQLISVLIGDMSLIGPRPLLIKYMDYYSESEKRRHSVKPGITGLAQVNGRNTLNWTDRLAYDVHYADNLGFWMDVSIVIKTVKNVFTGKDIVVDPESIMLNFDDERRLENTEPNKK